MINADHIDTLLSNTSALTDKNLFNYCDNNPINRADEEGGFWHILAGAAIGALVGGISQIISNTVTGHQWSDGLGMAMLTGAATGALAASGVGLLGMVVGGAAIAMAGNAASQIHRNKGFSHFDTGDMVLDGVVGGATGALGGKGKGTKNLMRLGKQTVKRTANVLEHKGISAALKNLPKVTSYYVKNSINFYADLRANLKQDTVVSTISSIITSDRAKNQYTAMLGW